MTETLSTMLEGVIDYAGLFPPAQLEMRKALEDYARGVEKYDWLVDRMVVTAARIGEAAAAAESLRYASPDEPIYACVVASPIASGSTAGEVIDRDLALMDSQNILIPSTYEIRLPEDGIVQAAKALSRRMHRFEPSGIEVFIEIGWGENLVENIHAVSGEIEEFGLKARTGGVKAEAFPSVSELATFISEAVSLEQLVKFTAGLHEPLRYLDVDLNCHRHGFLNAIFAFYGAVALDLNTSEIEQILAIEDPEKVKFTDESAFMGDFELNLDAIEVGRDWFGGFGSCSYEEPITGLRRLKLL